MCLNMAKRKTYEIIGKGCECRRCKNQTEKRTHKEITEKLRKQPYYFTEWDRCPACGWIQLYEAKKVWNDNSTAHYIQEVDRQESFFASLRKGEV